MLNDLKSHEKDAFKFQLETLFDHDETRAILATLHRIAERRAFTCTQGPRVDVTAARRWQELADAFNAVRSELERLERLRHDVTAC